MTDDAKVDRSVWSVVARSLEARGAQVDQVLLGRGWQGPLGPGASRLDRSSWGEDGKVP